MHPGGGTTWGKPHVSEVSCRAPAEQHSAEQDRAVPSHRACGPRLSQPSSALCRRKLPLERCWEADLSRGKGQTSSAPARGQKAAPSQHLLMAGGISQPGHAAGLWLWSPLQPPSTCPQQPPQTWTEPPAHGSQGLGPGLVAHCGPPRLHHSVPRSTARGAWGTHSICMCNYPGVVHGAASHAQVTIRASKRHLW